jgi:hypothetical protein
MDTVLPGPGNKERQEETILTVQCNMTIMARPERFELPTAWFAALCMFLN